MALTIIDQEAEALAKTLADLTGTSPTEVVRQALLDRLERFQQKTGTRRVKTTSARLDEIARRFSRLPVVDDRAADDILGYDERGLPR
ncbi:MAG: type II toxin-antitoxin system VapB family antitoxin [Acidobacteriota bacterium]